MTYDEFELAPTAGSLNITVAPEIVPTLNMKALVLTFLATGLVGYAADFDFHLVAVHMEEDLLLGKKGRQPVGEFRFENTSKQPLKVFGVGEEKDGPRVPALVQFQYKLKSAWRVAGGAGFGIASPSVVTLAPGETRILRIPLENLARLSATGRVGLRAQRSNEILWSAPIDPQVFQVFARN